MIPSTHKKKHLKAKWYSKERSPHKPILENPTIAHIIAHQTKARITQIVYATKDRWIAYQRIVILRDQTKTHEQISCQPGSLYVVSVESFNSFSRSPVESIRIFLIKKKGKQRVNISLQAKL
jgi:16S rRNA C1402 (ribose-2'-O) methylase RsmI